MKNLIRRTALLFVLVLSSSVLYAQDYLLVNSEMALGEKSIIQNHDVLHTYGIPSEISVYQGNQEFYGFTLNAQRENDKQAEVTLGIFHEVAGEKTFLVEEVFIANNGESYSFSEIDPLRNEVLQLTVIMMPYGQN